MFLASLYYSQTGWPVFYGNCYGSCFCRNSDLLPIEYSLPHAFPQRPVRRYHNRYAKNYALGISAGITYRPAEQYFVSYILMSTAGLIISAVMLRSNDIFSKVTAYVGILASVLGLGLFVPTIGLLLSLISVTPTLMWYILIARRLFRLS